MRLSCRFSSDDIVEALKRLVELADSGDAEAAALLSWLDREYARWSAQKRRFHRAFMDRRRAWLYDSGPYYGNPFFNFFAAVTMIMNGSSDDDDGRSGKHGPRRLPPNDGGGDVVEEFNAMLAFFYENRIAAQKILEYAKQ